MVYLPKAYKNLFPAEKKHKYNAKAIVIDGIKFSSKKEGLKYQELKLQQHCGLIKDLKLQPVFILQDGFECEGKKERPIKYVADFEYEKNGRIIVVDTKGYRTKEYLIKRKMFLKKYPEIVFMEE
jgi:hypothetical protein